MWGGRKCGFPERRGDHAGDRGKADVAAMAYAVWKFKCPAGLGWAEDIEMPYGAKILRVALQGPQSLDGLCLWALVNLEHANNLRRRRIKILMTGQEIPARTARAHKYIGTVEAHNGIVAHVFEKVKAWDATTP